MEQESKSEERGEEYVEFEPKEPRQTLKSHFLAFLGGSGWTISTIILTAIIAFSLGRYLQIEQTRPGVKIYEVSATNTPITSTIIKKETMLASPVVAPKVTSGGESVVASKNGTKYHYPWCAGAKQIAAKNLITFNTIEEARKAGYTPASNCKGLK